MSHRLEFILFARKQKQELYNSTHGGQVWIKVSRFIALVVFSVKKLKHIVLDFWDPLPEIKLQFKYILVIIDTNIKYVEIFLVKSTTQAEVAQVFYTKFIFKHGVPKEGHPDNGAPFSSLFYTQQLQAELAAAKAEITRLKQQNASLLERLAHASNAVASKKPASTLVSSPPVSPPLTSPSLASETSSQPNFHAPS
ncbi:hypothetical protein G6F57_010711 [Rhizopus arrhizus]|nr:hypothetical protein G6F28_010735 [Rhizopus arrhizus]KAG1346163.1 hypothetical protein G6F63_005065 [Rhizopus arrhizus]KAG1473355.1 hypothetical protein G6F57_010711 [Rhizopus arrhizus]